MRGLCLASLLLLAPACARSPVGDFSSDTSGSVPEQPGSKPEDDEPSADDTNDTDAGGTEADASLARDAGSTSPPAQQVPGDPGLAPGPDNGSDAGAAPSRPTAAGGPTLPGNITLPS